LYRASRNALIGTAVRLAFNNVVDAFHVVGSGPAQVRLFEDKRKSNCGGAGAIRPTDDLRRFADSLQGGGLANEAEAGWRLVETAWQLDLPRAGVAVQADTAQDLLFVEAHRQIRRTSLTCIRGALNGCQRGRCFCCRAEVPLAATDVDHFFPWLLRERGEMPDADRVWNFVLACQSCNRGERGKFVPVPWLVARLHKRKNWLVASRHPLWEATLLRESSTGSVTFSFRFAESSTDKPTRLA
jgi:hypothetical protein